ncbi:hypothetical protein [Comamonas sp.]|uniref:hypothetical protein n=1 Tax=Comamonas sp. TaxID=34028 RepID=UPI0012BF4A57|nr:hypothetical protein [Comamonas sp.]MPT12901.1 hypothetical protein [Comamonas sp.]
MKKQLILSSLLVLAGCNSAPGNNDIENSLNQKFSSCQNIQVVDIHKTNGYEEDGLYKVEFTYGIKLKDPSTLKSMKEEYQKIAQDMETWKQERYDLVLIMDENDAVKENLSDIVEGSMPKTAAFSADGKSSYLTEEESIQYNLAKEKWRQSPEYLKHEEIKAEDTKLFNQLRELENKMPKAHIYSATKEYVISHYIKGCPHEITLNILRGLNSKRSAAGSKEDPEQWFQEYTLENQATIAMRKTEKGWVAAK